MPAGAMHIGPFHGSCRETAKALLQDGDRQYVLSAAHWHRSRVRAAELEDQRRKEAGDTLLPARWADPQPAPTPSRGTR